MTSEIFHGMDEIDQQIATCLIKDGRMSNREIARVVNTSEGTVRYRLNRLLENNTLRIAAVFNPVKAGFNVSVQIGFRVDAGRIEEVASQLSNFEETKYVGITIGSFDIMVECIFQSYEEMLSFFTHKISKLEGVRRVETFLSAKHVKSIYHWNFPKIKEQD